MTIFEFESICVQEENFRETDSTTWIGTHNPISVPISSNLVEKPIFSCNSNPAALVESFCHDLDGSATQSKAQMNKKFLGTETSVKTKLNQIFSTLIQRRCRNQPALQCEDECIKEENQDDSTQFLPSQKNQFFDLQNHLEKYCNVLPVLASTAQNTALF